MRRAAHVSGVGVLGERIHSPAAHARPPGMAERRDSQPIGMQ